jgi:hypothetical protein
VRRAVRDLGVSAPSIEAMDVLPDERAHAPVSA